MTNAKFKALCRERVKYHKKLEPYFNKPEAFANRAKTEAAFEKGIPYTFPPIPDDSPTYEDDAMVGHAHPAEKALDSLAAG